MYLDEADGNEIFRRITDFVEEYDDFLTGFGQEKRSFTKVRVPRTKGSTAYWGDNFFYEPVAVSGSVSIKEKLADSVNLPNSDSPIANTDSIESCGVVTCAGDEKKTVCENKSVNYWDEEIALALADAEGKVAKKKRFYPKEKKKEVKRKVKKAKVDVPLMVGQGGRNTEVKAEIRKPASASDKQESSGESNEPRILKLYSLCFDTDMSEDETDIDML
jgi:hypothetical protein